MYALTRQQAIPQGTWYGCVHFSRRGQMHTKRFYDPKYGGNAGAKKAAIAWRDEQLAKTRALSMVEFCQHKRSHNTSGVPGVHFLVTPRQPLGVWQAKLKLEGKAKTKTFSVLKHGYQPAYDMAVAAREQMLATAPDRPYLYDPLAKWVAAKTAPNAKKARARTGSAPATPPPL